MSRLIEQLNNDTELRTHYYSFAEKCEVLEAYSKQSKSKNIAKITQTEQFCYNNVVYEVGRWVSYFRYQNNKGLLEQYKINRLNKLGMKWNGNLKKDETNDLKLKVLRAYAKDPDAGNGTIGFIGQQETYVYKGKVYQIGKWIKALRKSYTGRDGYKQLTPKEVNQFEALGMIWDATAQRRRKKTFIQNMIK